MDNKTVLEISRKLDLIRMRDIPRVEDTIEKSEINLYAPLLNSINISLHNIWLETHINNQLRARIILHALHKSEVKNSEDMDDEDFCEEVLKGDYHLPETLFDNDCEMEM